MSCPNCGYSGPDYEDDIEPLSFAPMTDEQLARIKKSIDKLLEITKRKKVKS